MLKKNFLLIFLISIIISLWLAANSYGTHDVSTFMKWTRSFFDLGFWRSFEIYSTYPHLLCLIFYFIGYITKLLKFAIGGPFNVFLLKSSTIAAFALASILLFKKSKDQISKLIAVLTLFNPAIFINSTILGYTDAFYLLALVIIFYLIDNLSKASKNSFKDTFFLWLVLVIGPFLKWQFFIFFPILGAMVIILSYKRREFKGALFGFMTGLMVVITPLVFKAKSFPTIFKRFIDVKFAFERLVNNDKAVFANFANFWQLVNYFHTNKLWGVKSWLDYFSALKNPLSLWVDPKLNYEGRLLFYLILGVIFITSLLKIKQIKKQDLLNLSLSLSLWSIFIYALFNTGVHENHFMPSVIIAYFLFVKHPGFKSFLLLTIFSLYNFLNLNYFYALGETGLFGFKYSIFLFGLNTSLILSIFLLIFFVFMFYRLLRSHDSLLGWL